MSASLLLAGLLPFVTLGTTPDATLDASQAKIAVKGKNAKPPNSSCGDLDASATGRYVLFTSYASNLVKGVDPAVRQLFRHDRSTGKTLCISVGPWGIMANAAVEGAAISSNGRYVAYLTAATNLGFANGNGFVQAVWHDVKTGERKYCSRAKTSGLANLDCVEVEISGDGKTVAFTTPASNLVDLAGNGFEQLYVFDVAAETVERVSVASNGGLANADCEDPNISHDGRVVVFDSLATNLDAVQPGNATYYDVFLRDRAIDKTTIISTNWAGGAANKASFRSVISKDGRYVGFFSTASNIVPDDFDGMDYDVFFFDRQTSTVSRIDGGNQGSDGLTLKDSSMSDDGRYIVCPAAVKHPSLGTTIINGRRYDRVTGTVEVIQPAELSECTNDDDIDQVIVSGNGKRLFFTSYSALVSPSGKNVQACYALSLPKGK